MSEEAKRLTEEFGKDMKILILDAEAARGSFIKAMLALDASGAFIVARKEQIDRSKEWTGEEAATGDDITAYAVAAFDRMYVEPLTGDELRGIVDEKTEKADVSKDRRKAWQTCYGPVKNGKASSSCYGGLKGRSGIKWVR